MQVWNIGGIYFGSRKLDHQTAKFNSHQNFPAIISYYTVYSSYYLVQSTALDPRKAKSSDLKSSDQLQWATYM